MRKTAMVVIGVIWILCSLLCGCSTKPVEPEQPEDPPTNLLDIELSAVITENSLIEPLSLSEIKKYAPGSTDAESSYVVIQSAMNGVVLFNCVNKNPDYQHPSIHTLLAYSVDAQDYKTIYQFPDDCFVLADIAFCGNNFYAVIFDQVHQDSDDQILYQVVVFEGDGYTVIDSGIAQSPFSIPLFHVLDEAIYFLNEVNGSHRLMELRKGQAHSNKIIYHAESNLYFEPNSLHLTEKVECAFLTHALDDEGYYSSTLLTFNNNKNVPVPLDTQIIALADQEILIGYDSGNTLEIISTQDMQTVARYKAVNKKLHVSTPINKLHQATMESNDNYQPVIFTIAGGKLEIRSLVEIKKDNFSLATIFNLGGGQWGVRVMEETADQFYIALPSYK